MTRTTLMINHQVTQTPKTMAATTQILCLLQEGMTIMLTTTNTLVVPNTKKAAAPANLTTTPAN